MSNTNFAEGLFYNVPSERAPEWILANMTVNIQRFCSWLNQQEADDKGNVKLVAKMGKSGKPYVAVDNWQPTGRRPEPTGEINADDVDTGGESIPF